jgi:thioredoxin 1
METISLSNLQHLLKTNHVIVVDFKSNSCAPCRAILPALKKLSSRVPVAQIDVEENVGYVTSTYRVTSTPTVVLFKNGREVSRLVGVFQLRDALQQFGPYI